MGQVKIYAGYNDNNRANIDDSARINGAAYSTLKGALDTQDANNRFFVYYNVDAPHTYNSPATFYYKEETPVNTITEGNTSSATELGSLNIPSFIVSSYLGDTLINFLRKTYIRDSRSFHDQYSRGMGPLSKKAKNKKPPKKRRFLGL